MEEKFRIQADQYSFPYHYLVDLREQQFIRGLDWGLDYLTYMRKVLVLVQRYATSTVLDVGCGDGYLLVHLGQNPALRHLDALGIDVDERPIKFAQAFGHGLPNVTFQVQDIAEVQRTFGVVTAVETLEHIPDEVIPGFVAEMDRVLEPGGYLIISVPSVVRAVIPKHHRHYDLQMLQDYFPSYRVVERHHVTARKNVLYQAVSKLLSGRHFNLNFAPFRLPLLKLHERFTSDVSETRGGHVVAVLRKPD